MCICMHAHTHMHVHTHYFSWFSKQPSEGTQMRETKLQKGDGCKCHNRKCVIFETTSPWLWSLWFFYYIRLFLLFMPNLDKVVISPKKSSLGLPVHVNSGFSLATLEKKAISHSSSALNVTGEYLRYTVSLKQSIYWKSNLFMPVSLALSWSLRGDNPIKTSSRNPSQP